MNQAEREVEYKRLDQVGRETVNLLHRGQLTEGEFVLRMEAVKAEIDALLAEAVSVSQTRNATDKGVCDA